MKLSEILKPMRTEIETDDGVREKVLPLSRSAVRKCSESIKETHRGNYDSADKLLSEAHETAEKAEREMKGSEFMSHSKSLAVAYQELAEAANLLSLLRNSTFTPPEKYGIPTRAYLTGLADTVGELRRAVLDKLRDEKVESAVSLLGFMEEILDELHTFDFPNALVPELRRKCDVARSIIERTRGDITSAIQQAKLVEELRGFEDRLRGNQ
ncbi:MAG: haloacid dehalogenase [Candidatus Thorarchaeota archaeon]